MKPGGRESNGPLFLPGWVVALGVLCAVVEDCLAQHFGVALIAKGIPLTR